MAGLTRGSCTRENIAHQHRGPTDTVGRLSLSEEDLRWLQLAESWLLRLLMAAAERRLAANEESADDILEHALLPALPEDSEIRDRDATVLGYRCICRSTYHAKCWASPVAHMSTMSSFCKLQM